MYLRILKIPDSKLNFFMELLKQLGFKSNVTNLNISKEYKEQVRNRIQTAKKEDYIPWKEVRKQLNSKTGN